MKPIFFPTPSAFRAWLKKNHQKEIELLLGIYKKGSGKKSITWKQAVEQALCFGWIDSVGKSLGTESYQVRFTRRKPDSIWSTVNINKVKELEGLGLMLPAGRVAFEKRKKEKSGIYAHEQKEVTFTPEQEKQFKANKKAWAYFQSLAPSYKKNSINPVISAKQESTKAKRLAKLIADSEKGTNEWKDNKYKNK